MAREIYCTSCGCLTTHQNPRHGIRCLCCLIEYHKSKVIELENKLNHI